MEFVEINLQFLDELEFLKFKTPFVPRVGDTIVVAGSKVPQSWIEYCEAVLTSSKMTDDEIKNIFDPSVVVELVVLDAPNTFVVPRSGIASIVLNIKPKCILILEERPEAVLYTCNDCSDTFCKPQGILWKAHDHYSMDSDHVVPVCNKCIGSHTHAARVVQDRFDFLRKNGQL